VSNLLLALGLLVIVGATAAYLLFGRESAPTDTLSAVSPGGPTVTKTFRSLPTTPGDRSRAPFPTIPPPPTISGDVPADTPPGTKVDVGGIEENKTIACDGNTVTVSGISNTVVITGHCARVVVAGIENVVTVDSADVIEASGIKNRVTFHTGTPKVDVSFDNTVEQG
jgi:hypothetical protein